MLILMGPALDHTDVQLLADRYGLVLVEGRPDGDSPTHRWASDGTAAAAEAFLAAAHAAGCRLLYVEPMIAADVVDILRDALVDFLPELDYVGELAENHEALMIDLDATATELDENESLGHRLEWRHQGVAHLLDAWVPHPRIDAVRVRLDSFRQLMPRGMALAALRHGSLEDERAQREADRQLRRAEAIKALVADERFAQARNNAVRKSVLEGLGLDLSGLNKEEIISLARDEQLRER